MPKRISTCLNRGLLIVAAILLISQSFFAPLDAQSGDQDDFIVVDIGLGEKLGNILRISAAGSVSLISSVSDPSNPIIDPYSVFIPLAGPHAGSFIVVDQGKLDGATGGLYKVTPAGQASAISKVGAANSLLFAPQDVTMATSGPLANKYIVVDTGTFNDDGGIYSVAADGASSVVALAGDTALTAPQGIAFIPSGPLAGNFVVADAGSFNDDGGLYSVTPTGQVTAIALASGTALRTPTRVAFAATGPFAGNFIVSDQGRFADDGGIFSVSPQGSVRAIALSSSTALNQPAGLIQASRGALAGNFIVADFGLNSSNGALFSVTASGIVTTIITRSSSPLVAVPAAVAQLAPITGVRPGDINSDNAITTLDLILLLQHLQGVNLLTGAALQAADVNNDSRVDVQDLIRLIQALTGAQPLQ